MRPFQRYKIPLGILALALAVFAAIVVVSIFSPRAERTAAPLGVQDDPLGEPAGGPRRADHAADQPERPRGAAQDGATSTTSANNAALQTNPVLALDYGRQGIRYYERYLKISPQDNDAIADFASLLFYTGQTDRAIQEVGVVLQRDPNHVNANYNLGIFYGQGRQDYAGCDRPDEEGHRPDPERPEPARRPASRPPPRSRSSRHSRAQSNSATGGVKQ